MAKPGQNNALRLLPYANAAQKGMRAELTDELMGQAKTVRSPITASSPQVAKKIQTEGRPARISFQQYADDPMPGPSSPTTPAPNLERIMFLLEQNVLENSYLRDQVAQLTERVSELQTEVVGMEERIHGRLYNTVESLANNLAGREQARMDAEQNRQSMFDGLVQAFIARMDSMGQVSTAARSNSVHSRGEALGEETRYTRNSLMAFDVEVMDGDVTPYQESTRVLTEVILQNIPELPPSEIADVTVVGAPRMKNARKVVGMRIVFRSASSARTVISKRRAFFQTHEMSINEDLNIQEQEIRRAKLPKYKELRSSYPTAWIALWGTDIMVNRERTRGGWAKWTPDMNLTTDTGGSAPSVPIDQTN